MVNRQSLSELVMALPLQKPDFSATAQDRQAVSPVETVLYMADLLENMRKMADGQGLGVLAHLLELARVEARMVARDQTGPRTNQT